MKKDDSDSSEVTIRQGFLPQQSREEVKAKNEHQYQQWFREASQKFQHLENQAQETQQVLVNQQTELQTLRTKVQQTAANTGTQIQQALSIVKRDIVTELADANAKHFAQLEAMLAKKTRQE